MWNSAYSPTKLRAGKNTIQVAPREAAPGSETLMDLLVVSTVAFVPTEQAFNNATPGEVSVERKIVNPGESFTVDISGRLGANPLYRFRFDLTFDPTTLRAVSVREEPLLSDNGAVATVWGVPQVDNQKGVITQYLRQIQNCHSHVPYVVG